jgi:hypothetical protein
MTSKRNVLKPTVHTRDANSDVNRCQRWRGGLCGPKLIFADYLTKKHLSVVYRANSWSLDHNVSKIRRIFQVFFRIFSCPLRSKDNAIFLRQSEQFLFPSPQNSFCFTNLSRLVLETFRTFLKSSRNLWIPEK